jgi:antitoxin component of RelBE/YafQ-DinJ toxin-antitoxin module
MAEKESLVGFSSKVKPEVKNEIYATAEKLGLTIGDALSYILAQANKPTPEPVTITEKVFSDETIKRLLDVVSTFVTIDTTTLKNENDCLNALLNQYDNVVLANLELFNRQPETITKEVEIIKEVPVVLEPTQFICDLPTDLTAKMRKVRPFMKKANVIASETANPTEIVTVALNYYLNNKWEHILNPAFR